jgi:hypothetical protein
MDVMWIAVIGVVALAGVVALVAILYAMSGARRWNEIGF